MKRLFLVLAAATLLASCNNEQNPPEVGGMSYNNYFFRAVNNTTQADFKLNFISASGEHLDISPVVGPGGSSSCTLNDVFALSGSSPAGGVYLYPAAHDLTTDTWVELDSEGIWNFSNEGVVVTLSYFLGHFSVSYEYVSRIN